MPLTADTATLNPTDQARFDIVRPLADYRLNFINSRYPLLSFFYAIFAGGESTLYCDHSVDYLQAYLVDSVAPEDRPKAEAQAEQVRSILSRLAVERDAQRSIPPAKQSILHPTSGEWDDLLALLKIELQQPDPVPPPPPLW
jgi:hypothetical protein